MKRLSVIIILFLFCNVIHSQTEKGHFMIGLSTTLSSFGAGQEMFGIGFSSTTTQFGSTKEDPTKTFGVNLMPKVGYFVVDNLALGLDINYSFNKFKQESTDDPQISVMSGIGCFGRYYIHLSKFIPFTEINTGFGWTSVKHKANESDSKSTLYNIGAAIGLAVPLGEKINLDMVTGYEFVNEISNYTYYGDKIKSKLHLFDFKLGFVVMLDTKN